MGLFNLCVEIKKKNINIFGNLTRFLHKLINILHFPNPREYKKYAAEDLLMVIN